MKTLEKCVCGLCLSSSIILSVSTISNLDISPMAQYDKEKDIFNNDKRETLKNANTTRLRIAVVLCGLYPHFEGELDIESAVLSKCG